MPRLEPVGKVPVEPARARPYRDDTEDAFARAGGVYAPAALKAASLPLLEEVEGQGSRFTVRDLVPTQAQFESVRNSLTNEIAVQTNATIATDYASMLPVVERKTKDDWEAVPEVTAEWEKFCANTMQGHANMRLSLAHHIMGAGQSYLYVETINRVPYVQFMTPLAVKGRPDSTSGRIRVWARVNDTDNSDEELNPAGLHNLWLANPLTSLAGWRGAEPHPWTWLMPMQSKFATLRNLGRALESMSVNRFLANGLLWFESAPTIARANPMGPAAAISNAQTGPGAGAFGIGGPNANVGGFGVGGPIPPPSTAPGPNPFGDKGGPHTDSGDHLRMVASPMPADSREDARLYLRVLDKMFNEPRSAAARAPFPVYWPKPPQFIQPEFKFDEVRLREEQAALEAIARASPMPFDFVLSSGSSSAHWSRSSMRREAIEVSQQHASVIDGMVQTSLFRLWLEAAGEDPTMWRLRSDVSPIAVNPDITEAVKVGYEAGVVSDRGFLTVMGIPEEHWTKAVREDTEDLNTNPKAKPAGGAPPAPAEAPVPEDGTPEPVTTTSPDATGTDMAQQDQVAAASLPRVPLVAPSPEVLAFSRLQLAGLAPFPDEADGWS